MSATEVLSARQWAWLFSLGLALAVVIVAVVSILVPAAALGVTLALFAMGAAFVARQVASVSGGRRAARAVRAAPADGTPQPTLLLEVGDGAVVSARPVPLPGGGEDTLMLTRDGYVVVNAAGKVLHRL